jgi:hypothetical protein
MRMTIYAVLAVAVGAALIGVLPTQLAAITGQGSRAYELQTAGGNETSGTKQPGTESQGSFDIVGSTDAKRAQEEFNADVRYYGLWVVNLVIALGIYFLAKRRLD